MSADFEGNDKDAVVTQQVLDVIDSYGFKKEGAFLFYFGEKSEEKQDA